MEKQNVQSGITMSKPHQMQLGITMRQRADGIILYTSLLHKQALNGKERGRQLIIGLKEQ